MSLTGKAAPWTSMAGQVHALWRAGRLGQSGLAVRPAGNGGAGARGRGRIAPGGAGRRSLAARPGDDRDRTLHRDGLGLAPLQAGPGGIFGEDGPVRRRRIQKSVRHPRSINDVPDAWLAAAAIHQGEHVISFDADFKRLLPRAQFTRLLAGSRVRWTPRRVGRAGDPAGVLGGIAGAKTRR